jgi:hypothetical protein
MKRLVQSIRKTLPPLTLYLDDIEYFIDRLKDVTPNIVIRTPEYELNDASELSDIKQKLVRDFIITTQDPSITLTLTKSSADLLLAADEPQGRFAIEHIYDYLCQRRANIRVILPYFMPLPLIVLFFVFLYVNAHYPDAITKYSTLLLSIFAFLGGLLLLCSAVGTFLQNNRYSIVFLTHRSDTPSFWQRNWEKLLIKLIPGAILLVASFLLGRCTSFLPGIK